MLRYRYTLQFYWSEAKKLDRTVCTILPLGQQFRYYQPHECKSDPSPMGDSSLLHQAPLFLELELVTHAHTPGTHSKILCFKHKQ